MWVGNEGDDDMHQQEDRRRLLARARPKTIAGQLTSLEYDPDEQKFVPVSDLIVIDRAVS